MVDGILHNFTCYDNDWILRQLLFKEDFGGTRNTKINYDSNVIFRRRFLFTISFFEYLYFETSGLFYCPASDFYYLCVDFFSVIFLPGGGYYKKKSLWDRINCAGERYHCFVMKKTHI